MLFFFYINEITVGLLSTVMMYTYDAMLYFTIQNSKHTELLQHDLDMLCQWEAS